MWVWDRWTGQEATARAEARMCASTRQVWVHEPVTFRHQKESQRGEVVRDWPASRVLKACQRAGPECWWGEGIRSSGVKGD